ncbi:MAG: 16S rRNA (cytidine(1402)-2'-O)-methyltransferase [Clostridiales bacterium]|jgi:16S rRNA (cytidine1402-2'-O)-methyltransferase|nr:16S rRNA (cytidine(1402)-2'-O)-methyltransferase [Clostridiales bacterium]
MEKARGNLFIVATPIGNLGDITARAIDTLRSVDIIAAEDTRRSGILLNKLGIKKPFISYYKEKENMRADALMGMLNDGKNIALITDAGTPCISDPGAVIVKKAIEEGITVTPIPGANAAVAAMSVSGLTGGYVFVGFLPSKRKEREAVVREYGELSLPLIFYSAPHDAVADIKFLNGELGGRSVYIMRELTKIHEEIIIGTLDSIDIKNARGEFVIIVEGAKKKDFQDGRSVREELLERISAGEEPKQAVKETAHIRKLERDTVYKVYLEIKEKGLI